MCLDVRINHVTSSTCRWNSCILVHSWCCGQASNAVALWQWYSLIPRSSLSSVIVAAAKTITLCSTLLTSLSWKKSAWSSVRCILTLETNLKLVFNVFGMRLSNFYFFNDRGSVRYLKEFSGTEFFVILKFIFFCFPTLYAGSHISFLCFHFCCWWVFEWSEAIIIEILV